MTANRRDGYGGAAVVSQTATSNAVALVELILSRIGQDFDGECHLTEPEARESADGIQSLAARIAELEGENARLLNAFDGIVDEARSLLSEEAKP